MSVHRGVLVVRAYEAMIVLVPTLDEAALEAAIERYSGVITDQGGQVTHVDRWGRRRLAYEIDGHRDAFYVLISFSAEPGSTAELERVLRISEGVLRFVVALQVATKRPAPEPAAAPAEAPTADATASAAPEEPEAAPVAETAVATPGEDPGTPGN